MSEEWLLEPPQDDGISPALRQARIDKPIVAVFGSEDDDDQLMYRLILNGIIYNVTFRHGQLVEWYVYSRADNKMLGGSE